MENLQKFKNYVQYSIEKGSLGLSINEILFIIFSFILAITIREFFAKIFISKIKKIVQKTGNQVDDGLFDTMLPPLKFLPIIFVFLLAGFFFDTESKFNTILDKANQTFVTIFIFWFLHQCIIPISQIFQKVEQLLSKALFIWLIQALKYFFIFIGTVAVLDTWGIKIGPIIAGLGLFGVAVALGAQDLFKNLISGLMIILEQRFKLHDVINIPGQAMGTVEHIGFRSTLIRQFDSTPIFIPNYIFSNSSVINFSDRKYRRIKWSIGLTYDTSIKKLKSICSDIEKYIISSENYIINESFLLVVRVEKFSDSSIDLLICAFTNTNDWTKYTIIKEELAMSIKEIVESNNSSFAFPSHSVYLEKK